MVKGMGKLKKILLSGKSHVFVPGARLRWGNEPFSVLKADFVCQEPEHDGEEHG
jgi:hypothetical protein